MEKQFKSLKCKECGHIVKDVGERAKAVTCSDCVIKIMEKAALEQQEEQINNEEEINKKLKGGKTKKNGKTI